MKNNLPFLSAKFFNISNSKNELTNNSWHIPTGCFNPFKSIKSLFLLVNRSCIFRDSSPVSSSILTNQSFSKKNLVNFIIRKSLNKTNLNMFLIQY